MNRDGFREILSVTISCFDISDKFIELSQTKRTMKKSNNRIIIKYYANNKLHRINAPAYIDRSKNSISKLFYFKGVLHSVNGPARIILTPMGVTFHYMQNGKRHREYGPAVNYESHDGMYKNTVYYYKGKQHRIDGPSEIIMFGKLITKKSWCIHGEYIRERKRIRIT